LYGLQSFFTECSKTDYSSEQYFKNYNNRSTPGQKVQSSGIPWDDASGNNLREWLGVNKQTFYNEKIFALMPMGFCFPGSGKSGDLAPRPECAPLWHQQGLNFMTEIKLTLLIGSQCNYIY
jgi:uracil-DNA glycosylase